MSPETNHRKMDGCPARSFDIKRLMPKFNFPFCKVKETYLPAGKFDWMRYLCAPVRNFHFQHSILSYGMARRLW